MKTPKLSKEKLTSKIEYYKSDLGRKKLAEKSAGFAYSLFRYLLLIGIAYIVLFPLLYMVALAFRPSEQLTDPTVVWLSKSYTLENIFKATEVLEYFKSLWFTIRVAVLSAIVQVFSSSICAYGLARFKFKEKSLLFGLVIFTIIVPQQAILIPIYSNFVNFDPLGLLGLFGLEPINLINSGWSFYLPAIFAVGINSGLMIFIYKQFFQSFPVELEEAAWIDGAGPLKTFLRIVLPSSGVATLVVSLFSLVWYWNDYMLSSLLFEDVQPLSVRLVQLETQITQLSSTSNIELVRNYLMAGCLLYILPILIFYLCVQKRFVESMERVGIVG